MSFGFHNVFSLVLSHLAWPGLLADTPIEEFTPTPAFPALQYLESVDEGGVAWKAGLRTGDFLIEVRKRLRFHKLTVLFLCVCVCVFWNDAKAIAC